jgi:hypothetical protein
MCVCKIVHAKFDPIIHMFHNTQKRRDIFALLLCVSYILKL